MIVSCFAKASCRLTGWKSEDRLDLAHLPFKCKTHTSLYSVCIQMFLKTYNLPFGRNLNSQPSATRQKRSSGNICSDSCGPLPLRLLNKPLSWIKSITHHLSMQYPSWRRTFRKVWALWKLGKISKLKHLVSFILNRPIANWHTQFWMDVSEKYKWPKKRKSHFKAINHKNYI